MHPVRNQIPYGVSRRSQWNSVWTTLQIPEQGGKNQFCKHTIIHSMVPDTIVCSLQLERRTHWLHNVPKRGTWSFSGSIIATGVSNSTYNNSVCPFRGLFFASVCQFGGHFGFFYCGPQQGTNIFRLVGCWRLFLVSGLCLGGLLFLLFATK